MNFDVPCSSKAFEIASKTPIFAVFVMILQKNHVPKYAVCFIEVEQDAMISCLPVSMIGEDGTNFEKVTRATSKQMNLFTSRFAMWVKRSKLHFPMHRSFEM